MSNADSMFRSREATIRMLEMIDEGMFDTKALAEQLLRWMSEAEVKEFVDAYEYFPEDEDELVEDEG